MSFLYESGEYGIWYFLILTILLGGAAAMATGRALALTWRPIGQCIIYAIPMALVIAFLHYALFEEPVIPLQIMTEDVVDAEGIAGKFSAIAWNLRGWTVQFVLLAVLSLIGYRLTRARQMATQYSFAYVSNGPMRWRRTNL